MIHLFPDCPDCHDGTCAEIECDSCGERYDEPRDEGVRHVDPEDALTLITRADWKTVGEKHYCPSCAEGVEVAGRPKRIQRKRTKGWRMPAGAIYVGRPTQWGNPFVVTSDITLDASSIGLAPITSRGQSAQQAVDRFREVALGQRAHPHPGVRLDVDIIREHLAGRDLACWCSLDGPCHADVLLELANPGGAS